MHIVDIRAFEALDSRGNPTLEVEVALFRRRLRRGAGAVGRVHWHP